MHQPKTSSEGGRLFSARGLAPPLRNAAAATARSTRSKGSHPAEMWTAWLHLLPRTETSPLSMRRMTFSSTSLAGVASSEYLHKGKMDYQSWPLWQGVVTVNLSVDWL